MCRGVALKIPARHLNFIGCSSVIFIGMVLELSFVAAYLFPIEFL